MKTSKFNNFSLVLATFLFAVGGVNITNAENIVSGLNDTGFNTPSNNDANVTITNGTLPQDGYRAFTPTTNTTVNVGYANAANQNNANNNKLVVKSDVNYTAENKTVAYNIGRIGTKGKGEANNNYAEFNKGSFRGVYVGRTENGGASNSNELYATELNIDTTNRPSDVQFRTGQIINNSDSVDSNYNIMQISNSVINKEDAKTKVYMSSGFIQASQGYTSKNSNANYNSLILKDTTIHSTNTGFGHGTFAGRIQKYGGEGGEASGNRVFVSNVTYNTAEGYGNIISGGFEIDAASQVSGANEIYGKANDNIAILTGNNELNNFYAGRITGTENGEVNNNLLILDTTGNVANGVYAGYGRLKESNTTWDGKGSGNAVYFLQGTVGEVVGSWGSGNTLILDGDLGDKKTGRIEKFSTLQFNVVCDDNNSVLTLTSDKDKSNLENVEIRFLTKNAGGSVDVIVGGDSVNNNSDRNSSIGGGKNAINKLTFAEVEGTKLYSVDDDEIYYVSTLKKEYESKKEKLNEHEYSIGDTFSYTMEPLNLTTQGKYYLIKSESVLEGYDKVKIEFANQSEKDFHGKTVGKDNEIYVIATKQQDQIYKILGEKTYTRNLRGMFVEDEKNIFITGIHEMLEKWENDKFDTDEFTKFKKPSESNNTIIIAKGADDLKGKTIYGGESTDKPVSDNSIIIEDGSNLSNATIIGGYSEKGNVSDNNISINQNASLSNTTIIGGYSKLGTVSNNTVDLNNTSVIADITLAQTDKGSIDISSNKLNNANGQTITGSLTVAKSDSAKLEKATYTMPENITITGDFILANSNSGNISNNTLDVTNVKATNIYVGKSSSGEDSNNTINIKGDKVDGNIYVGYSQSGATNNNIANFEKGEVTGTIYGGNNGTGNTLNVKDTKLKAGNVANFNIMNFKQSYLGSTTSETNAALILTGADNLDFSGVEVQIDGAKYDPSKDYGLGEEQKFYLVSSAAIEENYNSEFLNYKNSSLRDGVKGKEITHWDDSKGYVIDAIQTNTEYIIDNPNTFTRDIRGMFVADDTRALYLTGNSDIKETIGDTIGGSDFFTKFGGPESGNTITIAPKDPNKPFNLGDVTLDGGPSGNTLNIGKDSSNTIEMDKITVKDVQNFENINFYLPKNPGVGTTAVKLSDGSNTDLSNSNVMIYVDNFDDLEKQGGRVHLFDGNNELANNKPKSANYQIGSILMIDVTNSLDLSVDKTTPITPTDQTKIFNEARLGGLGALWQGQYLIANHLDRIIPDAFSELFPYAIVEGYDKRFNTGSHVDTVGFNANAGFASKGTNSSGEFTMGPFIEYGTANYDAYLDDGTHGDGKNYYMGGGFFGKQENNSGSYFEATFRIGKLITEFDGDLTFNKVRKHYDFDLKSTYIAAHAGLGKVFDLNANNDLDLYARYFYTHIEASEIKIDGVDTKFDAVQSNKIRLGAKHDYKLNENHKFYSGAAWEYEFDAKAGGRYLIAGGNTGEMKKPSLRGSTGIGEIGYQYKKDETLKFDVGVKGYVGKQEGVSAQMAISIAF